MLTGLMAIQVIQKRTSEVQGSKSTSCVSGGETVWLSHNHPRKESLVTKQKDRMGKPVGMSHNVYCHKPVVDRNILNHIINTTYQNRLVSNEPRRFSLKEIFTFILEFAALLIAFGMFVFFISISDGLDQHMIEWLGR